MSQKTEPTGHKWWFCLLTAIYTSGGFYLWSFVHTMMNDTNTVAGIFPTVESPMWLAVLDKGIVHVANIGIKPIFVFGIILFLGHLFLPKLSPLLIRWDKLAEPMRDGLFGALLGFLTFALVALSPVVDWGVVLFLALVFLVWGILLAIFSISWFPTRIPEDAEIAKEIWTNHREVWWRFSAIFVPVVIAIYFTFGFSIANQLSPFETERLYDVT
ncbi:MAG: hypothetical protein HYX81_02900 [Chloroflexi bacterium]|nr:hypothetical protein [Chloroflexota bacterium]